MVYYTPELIVENYLYQIEFEEVLYPDNNWILMAGNISEVQSMELDEGPTKGHDEEVIPPYPHYYVYYSKCDLTIFAENVIAQLNPGSAGIFPYGEFLRTYEGDELREPFTTTYHERDESLLDYRNARYSDGRLARFLRVDPMADDYPAWSPYSYTLDNPIIMTDPTGAFVESPIYDEQGNFLGTDSEGFTGEVVVMNKHVYEVLTDGESKVLDHSFVESLTANSQVASSVMNAELSVGAWQNITTDIIGRMKGVDVNKLYNGKTSIIDYIRGQEINNPENQASVANTLVTEKGIKVTTNLYGGKPNSLLNTVENVQNELGVHEYLGHGIMGYKSENKTHHKAYELQINHPSYQSTTPRFKRHIMGNYKKYLQRERQ